MFNVVGCVPGERAHTMYWKRRRFRNTKSAILWRRQDEWVYHAHLMFDEGAGGCEYDVDTLPEKSRFTKRKNMCADVSFMRYTEY